MVEIIAQPRQAIHEVMQDTIEPFMSPVTGEMIESRQQLHKHMKENNLANTADFTEHWKVKAHERSEMSKGNFDRPARLEEIKKSIYRLEHGYKDHPDVNRDIRELDR